MAKARERELQNNMAALQNDAADVDLAGVELRDLTMEADANRELFATFLTRFREIVEQQELQEADARIMSAANVPLAPSLPPGQAGDDDRLRRLAGAGRAAGVRGRALGYRLRLPQRRRDPVGARPAGAGPGAGPQPARDQWRLGRGLHRAEAELGLRRGAAADPHQPVPGRWRAHAEDRAGHLLGAARGQVGDRRVARPAVGALGPQGDPGRRRPAPAAPARGPRARQPERPERGADRTRQPGGRDQARRALRARLPAGRRRRGEPAGPVPVLHDAHPARGDGQPTTTS